tara:strand:- start:167 stop:595 length:429 start_codon:yes stop_codon:yes gene_type:complete
MEQRKLQTIVIFFNSKIKKGGLFAPFFLGGEMEITYDDFKKVQIKIGTVLSVEKNEKARKPSLVLKVDFGKEIGIKQSSAQITHYYSKENLTGKQVIGVCNFPKKNIAGVISEVLILGAIEKDGKVILVHPSQKAENGLDIA